MFIVLFEIVDDNLSFLWLSGFKNIITGKKFSNVIIYLHNILIILLSNCSVFMPTLVIIFLYFMALLTWASIKQKKKNTECTGEHY